MLPATERLLLGPGPSLISPRVMRAMAAPMLSHLDPQFLEIMDDTRARLAACVSGARRVAGVGRLRDRDIGHGSCGRQSRAARHPRAGHRHRILRRSSGRDVPTLWRRGAPRRCRMGSRVRSGRGRAVRSPNPPPTSSPLCTPKRQLACSIRSNRSRRSRTSEARSSSSMR